MTADKGRTGGVRTPSPEAVVTIWFRTFSVLFAVFWSFVIARAIDLLVAKGNVTVWAYIYAFGTSIVLFLGFGIFQRTLLKLGLDPKHWLRHSIICLVTWLLMVVLTVPNVASLVTLADPDSVTLPKSTAAVFLVGMMSVWMISGWMAVFWESVLPAIEDKAKARLDI